MTNYVKFLRGTPASFNKIATKDRDTLYFICEPGAPTGSLYLGDKLIIGGADITNSSVEDLKDVVIDKTGLTDGSILVYDWEEQVWVNKTLQEVIAEVMKGATAEQAGAAGLVPAPKAGDQEKFLRGDGLWAVPTAILSQADETRIADLESVFATVEKDENDALPTIQEIVVGVLSESLIPENAKESLDTLQEIAAWIQEHPDNAAALNEEVQELKTSVGTIESILNDTVDEETGEVTQQGLVSVVNSLLNPTGDNYVLTSVYNSQVGNIENLNFSEEENKTIVDEINSINRRLTWVDMTE